MSFITSPQSYQDVSLMLAFSPGDTLIIDNRKGDIWDGRTMDIAELEELCEGAGIQYLDRQELLLVYMREDTRPISVTTDGDIFYFFAEVNDEGELSSRNTSGEDHYLPEGEVLLKKNGRLMSIEPISGSASKSGSGWKHDEEADEDYGCEPDDRGGADEDYRRDFGEEEDAEEDYGRDSDDVEEADEDYRRDSDDREDVDEDYGQNPDDVEEADEDYGRDPDDGDDVDGENGQNPGDGEEADEDYAYNPGNGDPVSVHRPSVRQSSVEKSPSSDGRLAELERENGRLRKLVTELYDTDYSDVYSKTECLEFDQNMEKLYRMKIDYEKKKRSYEKLQEELSELTGLSGELAARKNTVLDQINALEELNGREESEVAGQETRLKNLLEELDLDKKTLGEYRGEGTVDELTEKVRALEDEIRAVLNELITLRQKVCRKKHDTIAGG